MTLKQMFPAGQLPDKFKRVREVVPVTFETVVHERARSVPEAHATALVRMAATAAKMDDAFSFERVTLRAAMAAHGVCPDCGGHVFVDTSAEVVVQDGDEREQSRRPAPVAFCSGCEFAVEMPQEA